jgi:gluconate:H+ symporter, GntP family
LIVSHNNGLLLIVIIAKAKWSPFIALLLASIILGIIAGMDIPDVADAVQIGIGNTLR